MTRTAEAGGRAVPATARCRICGGSGGVLYRDLCDVRGGLEGAFTMRRCRGCGLLWLDPQPQLARAQKFPYERTQPQSGFPRSDSKRPLAFLRDRVRRMVLCGFYGYPLAECKDVDRLLGKILGQSAWLRQKATWGCGRLFPPSPPADGGLVIDVGCGEGGALVILKSLGWRVLGIEPQPQGAATARHRGVEVVEKALDEAGLPEACADWVIVNNVLEHVCDPAAFLGSVFRLLKPAGTLALRVPNASSLGHRWFGRSCYHLDPPRHLFGFTLRSLRLLSARLAFARVDCYSLSKAAGSIFDHSVCIRRDGHTDFSCARHERGRAGFIVLENLASLWGLPWGEEIEVIAKKGGTDEPGTGEPG